MADKKAHDEPKSWDKPKGWRAQERADDHAPAVVTATGGVTVAPPAVVVYPEPAAAPGDEEQLKKLYHSLDAITDPGSLAAVLRAVASRCKTCQVHPAAIKAACAQSGVQ